MGTLTSSVLRGNQLLQSVDVRAIGLVEARSITLWTRAKHHFPGPRTVAGINWHARVD